MNSINTLLTGLGIIVIFIIGYICIGIEKDAEDILSKEARRQEVVLSHIGDTVIIKNDTLIITDVDMDFWNRDSFILNNGRKISYTDKYGTVK